MHSSSKIFEPCLWVEEFKTKESIKSIKANVCVCVCVRMHAHVCFEHESPEHFAVLVHMCAILGGRGCLHQNVSMLIVIHHGKSLDNSHLMNATLYCICYFTFVPGFLLNHDWLSVWYICCICFQHKFLSLHVCAQGEVFQVIGTQALTDLKDHISCVKDDAIAGDFSSCPNIPNEGLTPAKVGWPLLHSNNTYGCNNTNKGLRVKLVAWSRLPDNTTTWCSC